MFGFQDGRNRYQDVVSLAREESPDIILLPFDHYRISILIALFCHDQAAAGPVCGAFPGRSPTYSHGDGMPTKPRENKIIMILLYCAGAAVNGAIHTNINTGYENIIKSSKCKTGT